MNTSPSLSIRFIYQNNDYSPYREAVCRKLTVAAATVITLPPEIQIKFSNLGDSIYGSTFLEYRFKNRLTLNSTLAVAELPRVLVHELIHINQTHSGMLHVTNRGQYYWNGRLCNLTNMDYCCLPWERDVNDRLESVLEEALRIALA